jgi:predicted transcriptional regulator
MQSFHHWLGNCPDEAPAAENLATIIASAPGGISLDRLRRLCGLSPETLADVLRGLVMMGQVVVLKVGGQLTYWATG